MTQRCGCSVWTMPGQTVLQVLVLWFAIGFTAPQSLCAQSEGTPIESSELVNYERRALRQAAELRQGGKLLTQSRVVKLMEAPVPEVITLPPPTNAPLAGRAVFAAARQAYLRIGWYGQFNGEWAFDVAGGYPIAPGGYIATCFHCIEPPADTKEACLIAIDVTGKVYPVTSIVGVNEPLDAAIVRVPGWTGTCLPLNEQVEPGDRVYVYSDPLHVRGYLSDGIINRFYWLDRSRNDLSTLRGVANLRVNVSTDWAPGSSGAAVLDEFGNAVGHVAVIETLGQRTETDPSGDEGPPLLTLHEAIPARGIRLMVEEIQRQLPMAEQATGSKTPATTTNPATIAN